MQDSGMSCAWIQRIAGIEIRSKTTGNGACKFMECAIGRLGAKRRHSRQEGPTGNRDCIFINAEIHTSRMDQSHGALFCDCHPAPDGLSPNDAGCKRAFSLMVDGRKKNF